MRSRQIVWFAVVLLVAAVLWYTQRPHPIVPVLQQPAPGGAAVEQNHFSPEENLEQLDLARIDAARRTLDIAMYAFTDRYLADAIVRAAQRGVHVRIYRDSGQFEDEQHHVGKREQDSTTEMFRGVGNIEIRVKGSRELMHLKSYCVDGALLRDGSANWSPTGLKRQDNNARFTTDAKQVQAFAAVFEGLWSRDNQVVQ